MSTRFGDRWAPQEDAILRRQYPNEETRIVAERIGRSVGATYARANALGVKKTEAFLRGPNSGRLRGNRKYRPWTAAELQKLRRRYPHEKTDRIAAELGRSVAACYARAKLEGLRKTARYLNSPDACRTDGTIGQGSRFRKGHVPANKGQKGWQAGGRSVETQFKKGQRPSNFCPVGTYRRTSKDRHWVVKVQNHGLQRERWRPLHKLIWVEHHGPIPDKHIVRFKDGNPDNVTIDNLECVSLRENMLRNTIHNLPEALQDAIRAKGALTRAINMKRREESEKQD